MGTEIIKISTSPAYRMVWYTQEKYIIGIKISTRPATKNTCEDGSTIWILYSISDLNFHFSTHVLYCLLLF